jgi:hypothetical protein
MHQSQTQSLKPSKHGCWEHQLNENPKGDPNHVAGVVGWWVDLMALKKRDLLMVGTRIFTNTALDLV